MKRAVIRAFKVSAIVVAVIVVGLGIALVLENRSIPFDSEVWKKASQRNRGKMVDDLVNSGILIGQTREDAISLLGDSRVAELSYGVGSARLTVHLNRDKFSRFTPPLGPPRSSQRVPFDADVWPCLAPDERFPMAISLSRNRVRFIGMTREQMIEFLGPPDLGEMLVYEITRPGSLGAIRLRFQDGRVKSVSSAQWASEFSRKCPH